MGYLNLRRLTYMVITILALYTARRSFSTIAQRSTSALRTMSTTNAGSIKEENVWDYPRPPALKKTDRLLRVVWVDSSGQETLIAETKEGYRVLETSHPPTYYLPPTSIANPELISKTRKRTMCEWKGAASYFSFHPPSGSSSTSPVDNRIWTYENPTDRFRPIKDYLCFYASSSPTVSRKEGGEGWRCEVDGEVVKPQEGDFYGGWVHKGITGKMKGARGTEFW